MFRLMREDISSVLERDPAANNKLEVALLYSGLHAIWAYRLANYIYRKGFPFVARGISQTARWFTGVEIHPAARIGRRFFIDH
ncbi:MAG TPA: serine O-acetyltransferase, partial [bacterium]|nr:serine O-acetyltransferase [bacterium]